MEVEPTRTWGARVPLMVIPNPVVPAHPSGSFCRQHLAIPSTALIVVYLNRFDSVKRVLEMCDGFRQIQAQHDSVHFVLAGDCDNTYGRAVKAYASNVGLRAHFPGHLTGDEKWQLLGDATLMCQFSAQEAHSNALLEGLAAGVPVVISKGCNFDAVERHQAGVIVESSGGLAEAALTILADPAKAKMMGEKGRSLAEGEFSLCAIGARYDAFLTGNVCGSLTC